MNLVFVHDLPVITVARTKNIKIPSKPLETILMLDQILRISILVTSMFMFHALKDNNKVAFKL